MRCRSYTIDASDLVSGPAMRRRRSPGETHDHLDNSPTLPLEAAPPRGLGACEKATLCMSAIDCSIFRCRRLDDWDCELCGEVEISGRILPEAVVVQSRSRR